MARRSVHDELRPHVPVRVHALGALSDGGGSKYRRAAGSRGDRALPPPGPCARPRLWPRPVHPRARAQGVGGHRHRLRAGRDPGGSSKEPWGSRAQLRRRRRDAAAVGEPGDVRFLPRHRLFPGSGRRTASGPRGGCRRAGQPRGHFADAELRPEPVAVAGRRGITGRGRDRLRGLGDARVRAGRHRGPGLADEQDRAAVVPAGPAAWRTTLSCLAPSGRRPTMSRTSHSCRCERAG